MAKIIIAEDEAFLAKALASKLESAGHTVTVVSDGQSAIDTLTADSNYNLLLLDLLMPVKDGFSVLEALRAAQIQTKVLVLSNLSQEEDKQKVLALGASGYLVKSNNSLAEILATVESTLAQ